MTTLASPPRVLIVDDDADMRRLTCLVMELADAPLMLVGEAASGPEGLARWRADRPDIVVLDYQMPGQDGLAVAAEMLQESPGQQVILLTASLDADVERAAHRIGVAACLTKTRVDDLPDVIATCGAVA